MVKETVPKAVFHLGQVGEGREDLAFRLSSFSLVCSCSVLWL